MSTVQTITKLEAAKRQLVTAVDLFFLNGDPISIHTLISAAAQIVEDVSKSRGVPTLMEDVFLNFVKDEHRNYVRKKLRDPRNFFKHAEKDPEGELEFNSDANNEHLFITCSSYSILAGERVPQMVLFEVWFAIKNPHLILDNCPYKGMILELQNDATMSKPDFYGMALPMMLQIAANQTA